MGYQDIHILPIFLLMVAGTCLASLTIRFDLPFICLLSNKKTSRKI
jgi:hypothetical protein